ncbi:MAG: serine/threonine protein kinase [Myxococcota bacterium]|nr:serine/threonine protein kinase [Myxococcota bacterium]
MAADCQMCGTVHRTKLAVACPESRTGEIILGKYRIGAVLGLGGMAAVYAAQHLMLRREVALKVLHKRFAVDQELGARFVREGRETAATGHPAFVGVHDAGITEDGCAFIEMDRLAGKDLYSIRKVEQTLTPERTVGIAIAVLEALEVLHGRGVIHRDLKSANVYLEPAADGTERVKVLDLGFAKANDELNLTSPNALLGTPFYISPEQYIDPTTVDARADLFSLGIVMFEVLTGEWPYTYDSKKDLLSKVMFGQLERHPARRREEVPRWLDAVVAKALALQREHRFASAAAMREALIAGAKRRPAGKPGLFKRLFGKRGAG